MRYRDDFNAVVHDSIDDLKRKPVKEIAASAVHEQRPTFWRVRDKFNSEIEFGQK